MHFAASPFHTRSVLITGASGFIAANLARRLAGLGAQLHLVVREHSSMWRFERHHEFARLHRVNIRDRLELARLFDVCQPEFVFHLATPRTNGAGAWAETVQFNVEMALNFVEVLRNAPQTRLVIAGSAMEYGPGDTTHQEGDALRPVTWHGIGKAAAGMVYTHAASALGQVISQLRLFHVYGPWESSHRLLPTAIRRAYFGGPLPLTAATVRRDWIHIDDVVEAMLAAATRVHGGEVFNIGRGEEVSNEHIVELVEAITGRTIERVVGAFSPGPSDSAHRVADIGRAKAMLEWAPKHDIRSGIAAMVQWYRNNPQAWQHESGGRPLHV